MYPKCGHAFITDYAECIGVYVMIIKKEDIMLIKEYIHLMDPLKRKPCDYIIKTAELENIESVMRIK